MLEVYACELGQLYYLTMKILEPEEDDPSHSKWVTEDAIARGWALKTKEPHLVRLLSIHQLQRTFEHNPNDL